MPGQKNTTTHAKEADANGRNAAVDAVRARRHRSEGDCPNLKARSRWSLLKSIGSSSSSSSGKNSKRVGKASIDGGGGGGWGYFAMSSSSTSMTPAYRRCSNGTGGAVLEPPNPLDSCIDIIETVGKIDGLTLQQQRAIQNLRSIASETLSLHHRRESSDVRNNNNHFLDWSPGRSFQRREAVVGSKGSFLSSELSRCIKEMEDNREDEDHHRHVSEVLANYGGQYLRSALRMAGAPSGGGMKKGEEEGKIGHTSEEPKRRSSQRRDAFVNSINPRALIPEDELSSSIERVLIFEADDGSEVYCPPEWNALTMKTRAKLTSLLSCDNLSKWEFDIVDVTELSQDTMKGSSRNGFEYRRQCCPLLLVGWAILCAPMAQRAMEGSLGDNADATTTAGRSSRGNAFPYPFSDLKINPSSVCNFLREVESRYSSENPYHNNIHAADVTQTLHCLLQFIGQENLCAIYEPVDIFALILAATFHDVGHPGLNNLYHKNAMMNLAITYNDVSILENMHSAVGNSLLLGETKQPKWDVFQQFDDRQIERARSVMISAVMGTDMGSHFESVGKLAGFVEKVRTGSTNALGASGTSFSRDQNNSMSLLGVEQELPILSILVRVLGSEIKDEKDESTKKECTHLANSILKFLLHAADISNPAKKLNLARYWADMALKEFFAQGDAEKELGLPISPGCDRNTVKKPDSQIGFLKFVIRPTYLLLGEILPRVKEEVMPIIDKQIEYWVQEKARISLPHHVRNVIRMSKVFSPNIGEEFSIDDSQRDESCAGKVNDSGSTDVGDESVGNSS